MNVVGRVGSIITQGVYSVATPFHPFGGAVDIIVVQQQDGTFRSTPWYVRFGKFQGVLKGAEKIVRIGVNGVEANFHMYLDNSGEAYFIREVAAGKDSEENGGVNDSDALEGTADDMSIGCNNNEESRKDNIDFCRNDSCVSDNIEVQLHDDNISLGVNRIERTESDIERKFYEFQEEQSSLEGSIEISEYGSSRYENLDIVEQMMEREDPNSEVVLVSVDGHILTAPISSSGESNENVQLDTPQFHLGPGQRTDFRETNDEFSTGEAAWAADYLSDFETSTPKVASKNVCDMNENNRDSKHHLEVCEGDGTHACQIKEIQILENQESLPCLDSSGNNPPACINRDDVFQSCLELSELAIQVENVNHQNTDSALKVHDVTGDPQEKSSSDLLALKATENGSISEARNDEPCEKNASSADPHGSDYLYIHSEDDGKIEQIGTAQAAELMKGSLQGSLSEGDCSKDENMESQTTPSNEGMITGSSISKGFELSLCGNLLHAGIGLRAAARIFDAHHVSDKEFKLSAASIIKNENLVIRVHGRYLPWEKAAPIAVGLAAYGLDLPFEPRDTIPVDRDDTSKCREDDSILTSTPSGRRWRLWPIPFRRVKALEHASSNSSEEVFVDTESDSLNSTLLPSPKAHGGSESPHKQLLRTNVPTTEQIASLNLKEGQNMVTFSFSTRVLGMQKVDAHIYLWKWNARIVISDVDGTITKSDVLGQFMPLVGRDWTHSGIACLFSAIKENGYQLLFLSARAIVQAYLTRSFLNNLKQDGKALPNGPVVISPDGLFPSLYREVIRRAPHEFKIACLEDIKALFPRDYNPFYAGFGNRDTDELSYRKIGIPKGKIFIINPKGEVAINHQIDVRSYTSLHTLVNDMFPPTSLVEQEDYNSWNFWKMPLPEVDSL